MINQQRVGPRHPHGNRVGSSTTVARLGRCKGWRHDRHRRCVS